MQDNSYTNAPPPMYEPPKDGYPPSQPPPGQYPPQYPPQQPYPGQYPPQQPYPGGPAQPYPQGNYPPSTAVVVNQQPQVIVVSNQLRPGQNPMTMQCPGCHAQIVTTIQYEAGTLTWLACGGLILFGCWLGCCLIPFCINDLQNVRHSCPNCHHHIGTYSRI